MTMRPYRRVLCTRCIRSCSTTLHSQTRSSALQQTCARGVLLNRDDCISSQLGGINHYAVSITAYVKPVKSDHGTRNTSAECAQTGTLPSDDTTACDSGDAHGVPQPSPQACDAANHGNMLLSGLNTRGVPTDTRCAPNSAVGFDPLPSPRRRGCARDAAHQTQSPPPRLHEQQHLGSGDAAAAQASAQTKQQHEQCQRRQNGAHDGASAVRSDTPSPLSASSSSCCSSSLPRRARAAGATTQGESVTASSRDVTESHLLNANSQHAATSKDGEAPCTTADSSSSSSLRASASLPHSARNAPRAAQEAADYYRNLPRQELSKEEMWHRIRRAQADQAERSATAMDVNAVDYIKMEEEVRNYDLFHYRLGELAFRDETVRRDYYTFWYLSMSLNKARWTMLEVHAQRGMQTTGAGVKILFWKEAIASLIDRGAMSSGDVTHSHPVLRTFGDVIHRHPGMTKTFVRGFTQARLRVIQQPGSVKQLFDHFDKYYGYFFNSLLEAIHVKDEHAEHLMLHVGRALGLTQHCVLFWKKYAKVGFTMLPADLCADNHVNVGLLKNVGLASRDRAVRRLLYDVMCVVKSEMLHAEKLARHVPATAWPVVMECMFPNYYLGFLQRRNFNVSAMLADYNIDNPGLMWYRMKKIWQWQRHHSIAEVLSESAPLPLLGTSLSHRGSKYKMGIDMTNAHTV